MLFVIAGKKYYLINSRIKITPFPRGYQTPKISKMKLRGPLASTFPPHTQSRSAYKEAYKGSCRITGEKDFFYLNIILKRKEERQIFCFSSFFLHHLPY